VLLVSDAIMTRSDAAWKSNLSMPGITFTHAAHSRRAALAYNYPSRRDKGAA
jgi:hypothetical protein